MFALVLVLATSALVLPNIAEEALVITLIMSSKQKLCPDDIIIKCNDFFEIGAQDGGFGDHLLVEGKGQVREEATEDLPNFTKKLYFYFEKQLGPVLGGAILPSLATPPG